MCHHVTKQGKKLLKVPGMGQFTTVPAQGHRRLNAGIRDSLGMVTAFRKG